MDATTLRKAADTIRILSAEAIQKAKSGHPGMPMGNADFAMVLWAKYLRHNPADPAWIGRDRFVLSAGHGSMLIYSLLHLFNYGLSMDELKNFRQWGSLTPGHPEFGHTKGVDITTGPLGSGFGSAVGMAIAAKQFAARIGLHKTDIQQSRIFVISGDGCMMEGNTSEAASLAGHLKLDNLIVFYDDNNITIEGNTGLAFTENVAARYAAYDWRVLRCDDANDVAKVDAVLAEAVKSDGRPTLIIGKTTIGFGAPHKAGTHGCHGEPLGDEELAATKANLGWTEEPFTVPQAVKDMLAEPLHLRRQKRVLTLKLFHSRREFLPGLRRQRLARRGELDMFHGLEERIVEVQGEPRQRPAEREEPGQNEGGKDHGDRREKDDPRNVGLFLDRRHRRTPGFRFIPGRRGRRRLCTRFTRAHASYSRGDGSFCCDTPPQAVLIPGAERARARLRNRGNGSVQFVTRRKPRASYAWR